MNKRYLTTGQAARLCSVTRDAVFKWIRAGQLPARRTVGGHHRIDSHDLAKFAVSPIETELEVRSSEPNKSFTYCWEHHGHGGLLNTCLECSVYQMRARRCYEVVRLAPASGIKRSFCRETCSDCSYYEAVCTEGTSVLVVSEDSSLLSRLELERSNTSLSIRTTPCEYNCSKILADFRPDFVVVDCNLGLIATEHIIQHLHQDSRIPFVRIVMAGTDLPFPERCEKLIFGHIRRPFGVRELSAFVARASGKPLAT